MRKVTTYLALFFGVSAAALSQDIDGYWGILPAVIAGVLLIHVAERIER